MVTRKIRKREPMSTDELEYAKQIVADRSNLMTFCIPGALFLMGCFYVFGSLYHFHGATPSERTFLGVIPNAGVDEPHNSDSAQREAEKAPAQNVLKQQRQLRCGSRHSGSRAGLRCRGLATVPICLARSDAIGYMSRSTICSGVQVEAGARIRCRDRMPGGDRVSPRSSRQDSLGASLDAVGCRRCARCGCGGHVEGASVLRAPACHHRQWPAAPPEFSHQTDRRMRCSAPSGKGGCSSGWTRRASASG